MDAQPPPPGPKVFPRAGIRRLSQWDFANSALSPFDAPAIYGKSFKSRLITFEGVDLAVAERSGTSGHGAATCLFTGSATTGGDHNAQCESIDQYLARTKGLGNATRFPTLNLGVGTEGETNAEALAAHHRRLAGPPTLRRGPPLRRS